MNNKVILEAAYKELNDRQEDIEEARTLINILRESGQDATKESTELQRLIIERDKLMMALKNNGVNQS